MAKKLLGTRPQLDRFVSQYAPDGIVLFEPGDRAILDGASRCIGCARCDVVARTNGTFDALDPRGPMAFVLGVSRHSGEHDAAEISANATDARLDELRRSCPVDVPFVELASLVRRRKSALASVRHALSTRADA